MGPTVADWGPTLVKEANSGPHRGRLRAPKRPIQGPTEANWGPTHAQSGPHPCQIGAPRMPTQCPTDANSQTRERPEAAFERPEATFERPEAAFKGPEPVSEGPEPASEGPEPAYEEHGGWTDMRTFIYTSSPCILQDCLPKKAMVRAKKLALRVKSQAVW